jgi:type II secretion system protein G
MWPGRHRGFTLIEVLIVVVIVAVLAALIVPYYADLSQSAKQSTLKHNMHTLQSQIELYRTDHRGKYPTIEANNLPQLINATNGQGEIGPPGAEHPYGPYLVAELPPNPFDGSNKVTAVARSGQQPTAAVGKLGGWQYDITTGAFWPNHAEYYR